MWSEELVSEISAVSAIQMFLKFKLQVQILLN